MLNVLLLSMLMATPSGSESVSVQTGHTKIVANGSGYQILHNGQPFFVKGAGASTRLEELRRAGANSIRTWGVDDKTQVLLDEAHKNQLTVMIGFWMRKNDGFYYKNPKMLDEQAEDFRKWVRKYKNHPALLMWSVGNEVEIGGEWPEIWPQTERLAKIAKQEDPNHPVISVLADMWPDKMDALLKYCPSLDALGINSYDGLPTLHDRMSRWKKPYLITEYAFSLPTKDDSKPWVGHMEPSSTAKAESTRKNYDATILGHPGRVLGSYIFFWGTSGVGTAGFHNTHLDNGDRLAVTDVLQEKWSGAKPTNLSPVIQVVAPAGPFRIKAKETFELNVKATDPNRDPVLLTYEILPNDPSKRFIGDHEQNLGRIASGSFSGKISLKAPTEPGKYRVLVVAKDGKKSAATASVSFLVE